ncbi:nitrogen regulatory protein P-II [Lachnospiraceae bacterium KM106-2]|nr:nitrogen regulatory protein P-II [Lachnospiraceae bacterium KM106-2]
MKEIEIILKPEKMDITIDRINRFWIEEEDAKGVSTENIMGYGNQKGNVRLYRGVVEGSNMLLKCKLDIVVPDDQVDRIIEIVSDTCREGKYGDGKIFIQDCEEAYRIRTGESGDDAL